MLLFCIPPRPCAYSRRGSFVDTLSCDRYRFFYFSLCCLAHCDEVILQEDKISALVKAANVDVEAFWPSLFAKLLQKVSVDDIVKGMSAAPAAGGGAPAGGAAPAAEAAAEEEVRLIWEWWMCMVEVDRGVHFVARMVLSGWCASLVNMCGAACGICAYSATRNADPLPVSFVWPVLCLCALVCRSIQKKEESEEEEDEDMGFGLFD